MNAFAKMVADISKKPGEGALNIVLTFRGTEAQRDFVAANGGPGFLRTLLADYMAKQELDD